MALVQEKHTLDIISKETSHKQQLVTFKQERIQRVKILEEQVNIYRIERHNLEFFKQVALNLNAKLKERQDNFYLKLSEL